MPIVQGKKPITQSKEAKKEGALRSYRANAKTATKIERNLNVLITSLFSKGAVHL